jgi:putative acetyltransferase
VEAGIERLHSMSCPFIVVIGHPTFYPRFGFQPAASYGLTCEWNVPAEVFMVKILTPEVGDRLRGMARYRAEFSAIG